MLKQFWVAHKQTIVRYLISSLDTFFASFVPSFLALLTGLIDIDMLSSLSTSAWIKLLVAITFASFVVALRNTVKAHREHLINRNHGK